MFIVFGCTACKALVNSQHCSETDHFVPSSRMVRSVELAADRGPSGSSNLVASVPPSVAPLILALGGVSGGLMEAGEAMPPVLW